MPPSCAPKVKVASLGPCVFYHNLQKGNKPSPQPGLCWGHAGDGTRVETGSREAVRPLSRRGSLRCGPPAWRPPDEPADSLWGQHWYGQEVLRWEDLGILSFKKAQFSVIPRETTVV